MTPHLPRGLNCMWRALSLVLLFLSWLRFGLFGSPTDFNNGNANVWNENDNLNNNNVDNNNAVRPDSY